MSRMKKYINSGLLIQDLQRVIQVQNTWHYHLKPLWVKFSTCTSCRKLDLDWFVRLGWVQVLKHPFSKTHFRDQCFTAKCFVYHFTSINFKYTEVLNGLSIFHFSFFFHKIRNIFKFVICADRLIPSPWPLCLKHHTVWVNTFEANRATNWIERRWCGRRDVDALVGLSCYRSQTKLQKVMFLQVSVCLQGGCAIPHPSGTRPPEPEKRAVRIFLL